MVKFYAIAFTALGIAFIWRGFHAGALGFILIWTGISLILIGSAYGGIGPRIFCKSSDGTMSLISVIILLPFLLGTWTVWHLRRWISNGPAGQEIIPGIWLGRRPSLKSFRPESAWSSTWPRSSPLIRF